MLEGSLLRSGSRLRITAQLVEAKSALSLWTRVYERDVGDLIALQRDLARTVATELRVQLTPSQQTRLTTEHRVAPDAVEAYLRGRYQWSKRTPDSLAASIVSFEQAVRHDASYAPAYVGLASSYVLLSGLQIAAESSRFSLPKAREAAAHAIALDPELAEGHAALAYTLLYQWDLEESENEFERSIALNPNDANTRFWHAARLAAAGRFEESIAEASRGRQLDPVSPIITAGVSWMNHFARKHEQAAAMAVATMAIEPDFVIAHARRGVAFKHLGDYEQAAVEIGRCLMLSPDNPDHLAQLGQIHALQGRRDAAHQVIARLKQLAGTRFVLPMIWRSCTPRSGSVTPHSNGWSGLTTSGMVRSCSCASIPISTAFAATRVSMRLSREFVQDQGCRLAPGPASLIIHGEDWFCSVDLRLSVCTGGRAGSGAAECEYLSASSPLSASR